MSHVHRLVGALVGVTLLTAGCGDAKDAKKAAPALGKSSTPTIAPTTAKGCEPVPAAAAAAGKSMVKQGPVTVQIGGAPARLRVLRIESPVSIKAHYVQRAPFTAPAGSMYVGLTYNLVNRGPKEIKPSHSVNPRLVLRGLDGKGWSAVEQSPKCSGPVSASWAASRDVGNPSSGITKGAAGQTAVVFLVPKRQGRFRLELGSNRQVVGLGVIVPGKTD